MATLAMPITGVNQMQEPAIVKVVTDDAGRATGARRHVGIHAYPVATLRRFSESPPGQLEQIEHLEQLRMMENGLQIRVAEALREPGPAVDTPQDLARVATLMSRVEVHST